MNVSMRNISFSYESNCILNNVDFEIKGGEIHALIGENGAGKSTLMNLLGGVIHTSSGQILLDGVPVSFQSPVESLDAGIGFIHQELNLINDLTVYENMFIRKFRTKGGIFLDHEQMRQKTAELFSSLNIDIDPSAYVRDLDISYKQIAEICKALMQNAKVIIMDEPTTSLSEKEIDRVFSIMRTLRKNGVAIVFISHKLNEVMEICDKYSIMRNGFMIEHGNVADATVKELAETLVGHSLGNESFVPRSPSDTEVLSLEHFTDNSDFFDISLSVKAGEIFGVTGLLGDGRGEIFQTLFGSRRVKYSGKIRYMGEEIKPQSAAKSMKHGILYLPRNRNENGILADMSILDNGTIASLSELHSEYFLDRKKIHKVFSEQSEQIHIKMKNEKNSITSLSGGNQQKVLLGRLLMKQSKLLILDNPTQGVDVGAKAEIYAIMRRVAESGVAVIVLSPEAQEIMRVCNRVAVLFHGNVEAVLCGEDITEKNIMYYATGGGKVTEGSIDNNV